MSNGNHENHENLRILLQHHENHRNRNVPLKNHENHENLEFQKKITQLIKS